MVDSGKMVKECDMEFSRGAAHPWDGIMCLFVNVLKTKLWQGLANKVSRKRKNGQKGRFVKGSNLLLTH
jgi:hypothetical protein